MRLEFDPLEISRLKAAAMVLMKHATKSLQIEIGQLSRGTRFLYFRCDGALKNARIDRAG